MGTGQISKCRKQFLELCVIPLLEVFGYAEYIADVKLLVQGQYQMLKVRQR